MRKRLGLSAVVTAACLAGAPAAWAEYVQTNLVSDVPGLAVNTDPNLKNPWGISSSATSPFWVSNQATGTATLYNGAGTPQALVVTVPNNSQATPPHGPTGQVFNTTSDFSLSTGGKAPSSSPTSTAPSRAGTGRRGPPGDEVVVTPQSATIYTGLLAREQRHREFPVRGGHPERPDRRLQRVVREDRGWRATSPTRTCPGLLRRITCRTSAGRFTSRTTTARTAAGLSTRLTSTGTFSSRITMNGAGGPLESPWGLANVPSTFGTFANDLLVGSKDTGTIERVRPDHPRVPRSNH